MTIDPRRRAASTSAIVLIVILVVGAAATAVYISSSSSLPPASTASARSNVTNSTSSYCTYAGQPQSADLEVVSDNGSVPISGANVTVVHGFNTDCNSNLDDIQATENQWFVTTSGTQWYALDSFNSGNETITVNYEGQTYHVGMLLSPGDYSCATLYIPSGRVDSGGSSTPCAPVQQQSSSGASTSSSVLTATVIIPQGAGSGQNFSPSSLTVAPGTTITFIDQDTIAPHNVYFTSVPNGASQPAVSPTLMSNDTFSATLTAPGTYRYECQFHSGWMQGTIIVAGSPSSVTTGTSTNSSVGGSSTMAGPTVTIPQGAGTGTNFAPSNLTVTSGATVTFVDMDSIAPHNVYFTSVPAGAADPNPSSGLPTLLRGDTYSVTLSVPGTYTYECQFHSTWMQGTIVVEA